MSWYSKINLIKIAAAKQKIQRYSIANPSVRFFIHRYEKDIPWDEVEKVKSSGGSVDSYIQDFIKSNLLPSLGEKINPKSPDNNFMSPELITDEYIIQQIIITEEAHGRVPRGNYTPQQIHGGRDMILHDINNEKATQFNEWWKYMNEEEIYAQNPAFQYSILKPMIESSPSDKKNSSPPLNAELLAGIWDEITNKGVDQMNILKKYRKLSVKAEKERAKREGVQETEKGGKWIRIKGGPSVDNKAELKENINRLKNLSQGTGWCTARGMADDYLPKGDFYLYLKNDKAVVAIRLVGNKVAEIRGYDNQQKELNPYWQEVTKFLSTTSLDYLDNIQYKELEDIQMMNEEMVEGSDIYHKVLQRIQKNHKYYLQLSDENKQKFPAFRIAAGNGYRKELEKLLTDIEKIDENNYIFTFSTFQEKYDDIPPEIKAELPDMQARIFQVHKTAYNNNPNLFTEFSPEIQALFSPEEQAEGWIIYVNSDPYHFNDPRIPDEVRATIPLEPLKEKWANLIIDNPDHIDHLGKSILKLFAPGEIESYVLQDFANFPAATINGRLVKLERIEKLVNEGKISNQQIIDILVNEIRRDPQNTNWINRFPDEYKNEVIGQADVQTIINRSNKEYMLKDLGYFKGLPEAEQNTLLQQHGAEIGQAFAETLSTKYQNSMFHGFWTSVPVNVRPYLPWEAIDATAQFYANELNKNPSNQEEMLKRISPDIQPFVIGKLGANRRSWYKRAYYELV